MRGRRPGGAEGPARHARAREWGGRRRRGSRLGQDVTSKRRGKFNWDRRVHPGWRQLREAPDPLGLGWGKAEWGWGAWPLGEDLQAGFTSLGGTEMAAEHALGGHLLMRQSNAQTQEGCPGGGSVGWGQSLQAGQPGLRPVGPGVISVGVQGKGTCAGAPVPLGVGVRTRPCVHICVRGGGVGGRRPVRVPGGLSCVPPRPFTCVPAEFTSPRPGRLVPGGHIFHLNAPFWGGESPGTCFLGSEGGHRSLEASVWSLSRCLVVSLLEINSVKQVPGPRIPEYRAAGGGPLRSSHIAEGDSGGGQLMCHPARSRARVSRDERGLPACPRAAP